MSEELARLRRENDNLEARLQTMTEAKDEWQRDYENLRGEVADLAESMGFESKGPAADLRRIRTRFETAVGLLRGRTHIVKRFLDEIA